MKKTILFIVLQVLTFNFILAQKIKGSDTVIPLIQTITEDFLKYYPESDMSITGGGSGVGISALIDNSTDIAMASRKIKLDEKNRFNEKRLIVIERIIAYDALAIVVHPSNPVNKLSRMQLENIFRGKITNWKQVGGKDLKIVVYTRETSSGTYEFFKESVLKHKNYMSAVLSVPATGAVIQSISQTAGAIGYIGYAYLNKYVKSIKISYDGINYFAPTYNNAKNKSYPIVRPLYLYYTKNKEKYVKKFMDYTFSRKGQNTIKTIGYIDSINEKKD